MRKLSTPRMGLSFRGLVVGLCLALPLVLCSCRKSGTRSQYALEMCLIQIAGNPSPPQLFEWHDIHTNNLTYPDLPVAWPDVSQFVSVKNRNDIGLVLFPELIVRMGKTAANIDCQVSGAFYIKGQMMKPVGDGSNRVSIKILLHDVSDGKARISLQCDGMATMQNVASVEGIAAYSVSHGVDVLLSLGQWTVFRSLDYDGYKPLTLRLTAYRIINVDR